jgi:hypothetical protein
MYSHVSFQQSLGNKFFLTNTTLVWFFSSVDGPHVYRYRAILAKTLVTKFTLERFFLRMHPQMHPQVLLSRKFLITMCTLERFLSGVDPRVIREATIRSEPFPTNITQISFLAFVFMVPLNVHKIRFLSHVVVNFPTDLTRVRDVRVFVELQVRFEILVTFDA